MQLISMTSFVLEQKITDEEIKGKTFFQVQEYINESYDSFVNYANFLKQPLKLEMFVPCDDEGNVLKDTVPGNHPNIWQIKEQFEEAQSKVLFNGFIVNGVEDGYCCIELKNTDNWIVFQDNDVVIENEFGQEIIIHTIECLIQYDLQLTETAKKQIDPCNTL